jgi:hypothetical protein
MGGWQLAVLALVAFSVRMGITRPFLRVMPSLNK